MHGHLKVEEHFSKTSQDAGYLCFDITDLLGFLRRSPTVTGIQRVQLEATRAVLAQSHQKAMCCFFSHERHWQIVDGQVFCEVFDDYTNAAPGWETRLKAFLDSTLKAPTFEFSPGDTLLCLGATWNIPGLFESFRELQFEGVSCVFYIHDLLPLTHPEYFEGNHVVRFGYWFFNVLSVADGLICNSNETRDAVLQLSEFSGPVEVVDLNIQSTFNRSVPDDRDDGHLAKRNPITRPVSQKSSVLVRHALEQQDYVLMVGTLEPRKNHITALHVWVALNKALGDRCPKLVIVGKTGWHSDGIVAHLETLNRHGKVVWIQDATDRDLAVLYEKCLCTLYLSRGEGWGLPVSEALGAGKPVVCGKNSCAEHATQGLAFVVDECSERDVINTLLDLFTNKQKLIERGDLIQTTASFGSWADFGNQIQRLALGLRPKETKRRLREVSIDRSYCFGHQASFDELDMNCFADNLLWGNGWHKPENWGVWTNRASGELRFALPDNCSFDVYLYFIAPRGAMQVTVRRGTEALVRKGVHKGTLVKAKLEPDPSDPNVTLKIETDRVSDLSADDSTTDRRTLGFGLCEVRFVRSDDLLGRLEALERFVQL